MTCIRVWIQPRSDLLVRPRGVRVAVYGEKRAVWRLNLLRSSGQGGWAQGVGDCSRYLVVVDCVSQAP